MEQERYKPTSKERRMDKLLESRDTALNKFHEILTSGAGPKGLLAYLETYERVSNLIERVRNAHTDSKEIVIRFVDELNFEKEDGEKDEEVG
jgi:hypothetical protein